MKQVAASSIPENFDCHQPETGEYQDPVLKEPYGPHEIKLLLEIEIKGAECLRASFFIIVFKKFFLAASGIIFGETVVFYFFIFLKIMLM